jgi:hypothetical protein
MARLRRGYKGERRTEFFGFQLTPTERHNLDSLAKQGGMPKSELIRFYLPLGPESKPRQDIVGNDNKEWRRAEPWKVEAVAAVNRVGNNINQLAHKANETGRVAELAVLREMMAELKATLNRLV